LFACKNIFLKGYSPPHECLIKTNASDYLTGTGDQCTLLNSTSNVTVDCITWKYDQSQMRTTMITEYDFVCKRSYFLEVAYSLEQCGYVLGVFVFSRSADKKGRKPIFVSILFCIAVLGLIQYFVTNFYAYMSLGFVINFFASGLDPVTMPLIVEMFQAKKRAVFGIGFGYVWVVVITLLAPLAYILNTWRELKLLIFIILAIVAVSSIWLIEESLTWLISTNKISRAKQVLEKMTKINRLAESDSFRIKRAKLDVILDVNKKKNYNLYDSFTSNVLK
jgi:OCT family organic cation transporter-like MFS transporter 4/5